MEDYDEFQSLISDVRVTDPYEAMVREHFPTVPKYILDHYGFEGFMFLPASVKTRIANGSYDGSSSVYDDFPGE